MINSKFAPEQIKDIFTHIKQGKQIKIYHKPVEILDIKLANDGYDYAKVKVRIENDIKYLELYWEGPYMGIDFSEDINEFMDFNYEGFKTPKELIRSGIKYQFGDHGCSTVIESDPTGDYHQGDKVNYWEYFSPDKLSRISLGYNQRSKRWLNMHVEKLLPKDIKVYF